MAYHANFPCEDESHEGIGGATLRHHKGIQQVNGVAEALRVSHPFARNAKGWGNGARSRADSQARTGNDADLAGGAAGSPAVSSSQ